MVSFMRRADGADARAVRRATGPRTTRRWRGTITSGCGTTRRTSCAARYTPGGDAIDGIAELHFRTRADFVTEFFDSDEGRAIIAADVRRFIAGPSPESALMRELPLRT